MSQLRVIKHTVVDLIPIGRRITELMKEKGAAYSIQALSNRLNISRETFRLMVAGKRDIYFYELEQISSCLHVPTKRILQEDIQKEASEFSLLLESKSDLQKAFELAKEMNLISIGITERMTALTKLAKSIYALGDYHQAHDILLQSYQLAEQMVERFKDYDRLYDVLSKLMLTFTLRKEFSRLSEVLERVEGYFVDSPEKQGAIHYSKAMIAEHYRHIDQERENWYRSIECFQRAGKENDQGRAELNAGYFEFRQQNYEEAKQLMECALIRLENDLQYRMVVTKEYAKTLLKLGEIEKAIALLEENLEYLDDYPQLKGKYFLLLAMAHQDASYIEKIYAIPEAEKYFL